MIRRPSPATALALTAPFVSLGGTSYAALSITGKNVKNSSLTGPQGATGPHGVAGPEGPIGPQGSKGDTGTVDTSNFYTKSESDNRHGIISAQAANQSVSADWRFLGAVQDFEFHSDCVNNVVTFRISNTVPVAREVLVERWSATTTPAIEAISIGARVGPTNGTATPAGTESPFHDAPDDQRVAPRYGKRRARCAGVRKPRNWRAAVSHGRTRTTWPGVHTLVNDDARRSAIAHRHAGGQLCDAVSGA
jgi:hypothetical protein